MTRFSLVLPTINRTNEVRKFLTTLDRQTYRQFELIVVDQNKDGRLLPVLKPYEKKFSIVHCTSKPGLSAARNVGLKYIVGDVVAFPDDDCLYPPELLERVAAFLDAHPNVDGVTGRAQMSNPGQVGTPRFDKKAGFITKANAWTRVVSISIFVRRKIVEEIGGFDESLGVGAGTPWEGGEDTDYPLRAVKAGFKIYYTPDLYVLHPSAPKNDYPRLADRAYKYGAGIGRVLRKHDYPLWFVAYFLLRPLGGAFLSFVAGRRDKARFHIAAFRGRFRGWLLSK
jgi:GT2 family glycosyltransferase